MEECTSGSQLLDEDLNIPGDSPGVHSQLGPKPHTDDSMEVVVIQSLYRTLQNVLSVNGEGGRVPIAVVVHKIGLKILEFLLEGIRWGNDAQIYRTPGYKLATHFNEQLFHPRGGGCKIYFHTVKDDPRSRIGA